MTLVLWAQAVVAGIRIQISADTVGGCVGVAAQRNTNILRRCLLHLRSDSLSHGFPAVDKPGLPIFAEFVFTVLRVFDPGTCQTGTIHLPFLLSSCGIGCIGIVRFQILHCRIGGTSHEGCQPVRPEKGNAYRNVQVCDGGFCSK